jgi:hypothetical protein
MALSDSGAPAIGNATAGAIEEETGLDPGVCDNKTLPMNNATRLLTIADLPTVQA